MLRAFITSLLVVDVPTWAAVLSSPSALTRQNQSLVPCVAQNKTCSKLKHQLWSGARSREVATLDKLIDDGLLSSDDGRWRPAHSEEGFLAHFMQPEGNETDEQLADVRLVFTNAVAIMNFAKHWTSLRQLTLLTVVLAHRTCLPPWYRVQFSRRSASHP